MQGVKSMEEHENRDTTGRLSGAHTHTHTHSSYQCQNGRYDDSPPSPLPLPSPAERNLAATHERKKCNCVTPEQGVRGGGCRQTAARRQKVEASEHAWWERRRTVAAGENSERVKQWYVVKTHTRAK